MKRFALFIFTALVGLFAAMGLTPRITAPVSRPPTNSASLQMQNIWRLAKITLGTALMEIRASFGRAGFSNPPLALGITAPAVEKSADAQILESLESISKRMSKVDEIEKAVTKNKEDYETVTKLLEEVRKDMLQVRKLQLEERSSGANRNPNEISAGCAKWLGGVYLMGAMARHEKSAYLKSHQVDSIRSYVKDTLDFDLNTKAALTASDIPLPVQYSGEIVEFVYQFGQARKVGTVFPLGAASVKLPKLSTDPTFGLIATSGTVTEKSPQIAFVTFTAEKFGGLVRLPEEIDEDSIVAMGQFLARYCARQIAYVEDWQFFMSTGADSGINGLGQGLCKAVVTDACVYNQGGTTSGGFTKQSQATLVDFRNLRSASTLSGIVLQRAKYYMHPSYEALLVQFNTSATVTPYLRATGNSPATLDGFEIVWVPVMPAYSTSVSVSLVHVLFGDASYQYLGLRNGIRFDTSRDAAFATDEILVRCLERMTVALMASKAIAGLVTDAS